MGERGQRNRCKSSGVSSYQGTNHIYKGTNPTLRSSSELNYLSKSLSPNVITLRVRASVYELRRGGIIIQSIAMTYVKIIPFRKIALKLDLF